MRIRLITIVGCIPGATSSSYTPPVFNTIGSYYYYCEITLSGNGCDVAISNVAQVDVINSPSATISTVNSICYEDQNLNLITSATPGTGAFGIITNSYWEIIDDVTGTVVWDDLPGNSSLIIPTFTTSIWNNLQQGVGPKIYLVKLTIF